MGHLGVFAIQESSPIAPKETGVSQQPQFLPLLAPSRAWRILHQRIGKQVARSTFYRWIECGKIPSVRLGARLYVPWGGVDQIVRKCLDGEPL